jgi:hypothetical protein
MLNNLKRCQFKRVYNIHREKISNGQYPINLSHMTVKVKWGGREVAVLKVIQNFKLGVQLSLMLMLRSGLG